MVKKTINVETKIALQSRSSTKEIDQNYPRDFCSANFIVTKSQGSVIKDSRTEELKIWGIESSLGL